MKKQITQPESNLTQLVERGYAIHQQLNLLNEEFKQIKDRLKAEGVARPGEHVPLADHYDKLFREVTTVQIIDRDRFRAYAQSLLPTGVCTRLFELCSTPSEPKALWKGRAKKSNR
jgi:hypothetical protein